jgi:hypothetical protein
MNIGCGVWMIFVVGWLASEGKVVVVCSKDVMQGNGAVKKRGVAAAKTEKSDPLISPGLGLLVQNGEVEMFCYSIFGGDDC